jgi:hypothetical protein
MIPKLGGAVQVLVSELPLSLVLRALRVLGDRPKFHRFLHLADD